MITISFTLQRLFWSFLERTQRPGRAVFFLLILLLLFANSARAQGYYEQFGPYCLGDEDECFGDPVDVGTGSFHIKETLFTIPGRVPFTIGWQFLSQDASQGPLGVGTSLSTDYFFAFGDLELLAPGNRHFLFTAPDTNGDFTNVVDPNLLGAVLHFTSFGAGRSGIVRLVSGVTWFFDPNGALSRIQDRHGNSLTITRNSKGYPTEVIGPDGRSTRFVYNAGGRLETITSSLGRIWQFSYDGEGRLISVTDPTGAQIRYTWISYNRGDAVLPLVQSVIDREGHTHVTNKYDDFGRIISQTYADGGVLTASYSYRTSFGATTTVTDPLGNVTTWDYEWNPGLYGYRVTRMTDPLGRVTAFEYAGDGNVITGIVDYRGRRTMLGWDLSRGLLVSVSRPTASGGTATWNYAYDAKWNRLTSMIDPLSRQTKFNVDPTTGDITGTIDARNNTTAFRYSAKGDLISVIDALGQTTSLDYTEEGDVRKVTDPLNRETEFNYDAASRLTAIRDANLKTTQISYNAMDQVTAITRTLNGRVLTTTFQYDEEGNMRFLTDAKNQTWEWIYDDMDQVVQEINPLSQSAFYTWDQNGNLLSWTDRLGQIGEFSYGKDDLLKAATFSKITGKKKKKRKRTIESTVSYTYNEGTQLIASITDSQFGTYSYTYDGIGRLIGRNGPNGSISYTLDDVGRRIGMQVTGQGAIEYDYDATDNVTSIKQDGQIYSFSYDSLDRLIKRQLPNGISTEWAFDEAGFLKSIVSGKPGQNPFDSRTYSRDALGNITQENVNGDVRAYVYDDLYQIISATVAGANYSWTYDEVGNRLTQTIDGKTTNYSYDAGNRQTSVSGVALTYDANGNLLAYGDDTYSWDVRGRLVSATRGGSNTQFTYDMLGLRTGKNVNGTATSYLLDGDDVVSEISAGIAIQTLHGPDVDQPLSRGGLYFTPDHLGSTTTLTDAGGNVIQRYLYSPFGETSQTTGVKNPFQFTGRESDETGLYYYRARYYAPNGGRFISEDPIGFRGGQVNLLAYVQNNPVNGRDPTGTYGPLGGFSLSCPSCNEKLFEKQTPEKKKSTKKKSSKKTKGKSCKSPVSPSDEDELPPLPQTSDDDELPPLPQKSPTPPSDEDDLPPLPQPKQKNNNKPNSKQHWQPKAFD